MPGATQALWSLICSLAGFVVCPCLYPVGAFLGYQALQLLPPDAERGTRSQAQFGMWVGIIGLALMVVLALLFALLVLLGVMTQNNA